MPGSDERRDEINNAISETFKKIAVRAGYRDDKTWNLEYSPGCAEKLGRLFFDYMVAATGDTCWEGFEESDMVTILLLITDMAVAQEAGLGQ